MKRLRASFRRTLKSLGAAALLAALRPLPAAPASWPAFRHDSRRTGYNAEQAYPPLALRWRRVTGGPVVSSPAVAYGKVYVGSRARVLLALDAFTGAVVWTYRTSGWIDSSPAVADGRVFVASRDGTLHAVDAANGNPLWTYPTGSTDLASPAVVNGEVFMATGYPSKLLLVLDARTGALKRTGNLSSFSNSSPTVDPALGLVFAGANDGSFTAYSLNNPSSIAWSTQTLGGIYFSTLAEGATFVFGLPGNDDRWARGFHPATGATGWVSTDLSTGSVFVGSPAVAGGRVVAAAGVLPTGLFGLDASNGAVVWGGVPVGNAPDSGFTSSPALANDVVFVGGGDGNLYAVSLATGGVLAAYNLGSAVLSSPAVANGWVYVGTMNGQVFAFQSARVTALASPDPNLEPQISGIVPLQGYVLAPDLVSYSVEFGSGTSPAAWTTLAQSTTQANGTLLANWNTLALSPGFYSVRVVQTDSPASSLVAVTTAVFAVTQSSLNVISAALGGAVALADGTELLVPAGALVQDSTVTMTRLLTGYPDSGIPSTARATSIVRDIQLAGSPHPTFKIPVTLKMPYALSDLAPGGVEKNLRIYFYDDIRGQWRIVNTSVVHADEKRVWATMDHLTTFRVMEYLPAAGDLVTTVYSYPNPARGDNLTFKFLLTEDSDVKITVYSVSGEPVAQMSQTGNPAGLASTLVWDMSSKASGVYLYLFEATSATRTMKVKKFLSIVH